MSSYFSKLKDLYEEFEALVPALGCDCDKSKEYVLHLQKLKLFQFLMGLNESYTYARNQVFLMTPLPYVNQAYAMVISDESHKLQQFMLGSRELVLLLCLEITVSWQCTQDIEMVGVIFRSLRRIKPSM